MSGQIDKSTEIFIKNLEDSSRILKGRFIIIGIFSIVALGFMYTTLKQGEKNSNLVSNLIILEHLRDTRDLKGYVENFSDSVRKHILDNEQVIYVTYSYKNNVDYNTLFYKLKESDYKDRTPILEAISDGRNAISANGFSIAEQSVNFFGISIPAGPALFIGPLVILILFHDLTQIIFYRRRIRQKLYDSGSEELLIGPEYHGIQTVPHKDSWRFFVLVSSVIFFLFLLSPVVAAGAFAVLSSVQLPDSLLSNILQFINYVCLFIVIIDFCLIIRSENFPKYRLRDILETFKGTP